MTFNNSQGVFEEYSGNWGAVVNSLTFQSLGTSAEDKVWPGLNPGDAIVCDGGSVVAKVNFRRRSGDTNKWSEWVELKDNCCPQNEIAFCPVQALEAGAIVLHRTNGLVSKAVRYDANGLKLWANTENWLDSDTGFSPQGQIGFAEMNGSIYAYGASGVVSYGPWFVKKLNADGTVAKSIELGKPQPFNAQNPLFAAQVTPAGLVLAGSTTFKLATNSSAVVLMRVVVDATPAFVCQPQ